MSDQTFAARLRRNAERYAEIEHLRDRITDRKSGYAHCDYTVRLDDETRRLTNDDLVLLCDQGNACFGGHVNHRFGDFASVTVYTD